MDLMSLRKYKYKKLHCIQALNNRSLLYYIQIMTIVVVYCHLIPAPIRKSSLFDLSEINS